MMHKKSIVVLTVVLGILGFVGIIFIGKYILDNPYRKQLPTNSDIQSLTLQVQEQITNALNTAQHNPSSDNLGMLAMVYHSCGMYDNAATCYKLAVKRNQNKWLWSYYLGYLNRELGESNSSIDNFKMVIKQNPNNDLAWYYIGEGLQKLGKNDQSELILNKISNRNDISSEVEKNYRNDYFPLSTYAKYHLSRIYLNTGRYDQAGKNLNEIIRTSPTFGPAYRLLGNYYRIKGDSLLSKDSNLQADDLTDSSNPLDKLVDGISLLSRSDQYLLKQIDESEKKARPDFALVLADHALKYNPHNKYLISKSVKLLLNMNYGKQALPFLQDHFNFFSDDYLELKEVGNLLYDRGLYAQSLNYFTKAEQLKPEDTEVKLNQVLCLWKDGKIELATEKMNAQIQNDKANLKILTNGVYAFLLMGERDLALSLLRNARKISSTNPKVQLMTGMLADMEGKYVEALVQYEFSYLGNPKDMATIQALGKSYAKEKMWSAAINLYRQALAYLPHEPYLLEKLGSLLISCPDEHLRNIDEGMKLSGRAFIHKASTPDITIAAGKSIAMAYALKGDYTKACEYAEWITGLAKSEKAPAEYLQELENLLQQYIALKEKQSSMN
jgi:tetratricopeptide (TPR) repeat protein